MSVKVLALDLERTLIDDALSGRPRPGLSEFLSFCDERFGRVADFAPACAVARDAGLAVVPHGGFYTPAAHVADCVRLLGASRIGQAEQTTCSGTASSRQPRPCWMSSG